MGILLDVILVAVVLVFAFISAKRGFVRTVIELAGWLLAVVLAFSVSGAVADYVYDDIVAPKITESLVQAVENSAEDALLAVTDHLPDYVVNAAAFLNVDINALIDQNVGKGAGEVVGSVTQTVVRPIVTGLIRVIAGLILFTLLMFVVRFLARTLNRLFNIPIIGGVNRLLGGVLGAAKGLVVAVVLVFLLSTIVALTQNGFLIFTKESIDSSYLFKFIAGFNPMFK